MKEEKKKCILYIVRHGESEANVNKITQGHTDSPLTEKGEKQAKEIAETFRDIEFDAIYSSDLGRSKRTAEIIGAGRDIKIKTLPSLREKYFGIFEGKNHTEFVETLKDEFKKFENDLTIEEMWEHKAHSSIESDKELLNRTMSSLREIVSAHPGEKVLIVGHRYSIRMALVSLGWGTYEDLKAGALRNGGYAVLESDGVNFLIKEVVGAERPPVV